MSNHGFAARSQVTRVLICKQKLVLVCDEKSRRNGIDTDTWRIVLCHVNSEPLRKVTDRRLRCRIRRDARKWAKRIHRRDVEDHAFAALCHTAPKNLARQNCAEQIQITDITKCIEW